MDNKELLNSMSEIKDEYVEEAVKTEGFEKKSKSKIWGTALAGIAAVLAICIGVGSFGLGRAKSAAPMDMAYAEESAASTAGYGVNGYYDNDVAAAVEAPAELAATEDVFKLYDGEIKESGSSVQKAENKLIKRANLSIQTLDFEATESELYALVESLGGYFENKYIDNGGIWSDGSYKYASYTVRVPADKYDQFLGSVNESCHISDLSESVEDIGEQYFDVETRLRTLNTKLERLEDLLAKASDLSDIIALESEISNTEYEIDSYTSTLNRYDSLVGYATIDINLQYVNRVDDGINQDNSYLARLWRSLKNGLVNFADSIGDLISWAAYNLAGIVIIVIAIVIIKKKHLISKFIGLFKRNR